MISAQQIEQFCRIENYKLLVSAEKQLADPLFSSYSVEEQTKLFGGKKWTKVKESTYLSTKEI